MQPKQYGDDRIQVTHTAEAPAAVAPIHTNEQGTGELCRVRSVYLFDGLEELLFCCARLHRGYLGQSEAYFEPLPGGGERYYLVLWEKPGTPGESFPFLWEFAGRVGGTSMLYIREHSRLLAKGDAVKRLAELA